MCGLGARDYAPCGRVEGCGGGLGGPRLGLREVGWCGRGWVEGRDGGGVGGGQMTLMGGWVTFRGG